MHEQRIEFCVQLLSDVTMIANLFFIYVESRYQNVVCSGKNTDRQTIGLADIRAKREVTLNEDINFSVVTTR